MSQTSLKQIQQTSIIGLVNIYRNKARNQYKKQQFNQHDYLALRHSINEIKQKYQNLPYFQKQKLKTQSKNTNKQNICRDSGCANHNDFYKGILQNYIDDIKKNKKIKLLLGMNQKNKLTNQTFTLRKSYNIKNNKNQNLRSINSTKCTRYTTNLINKIDNKIFRNSAISKDQNRKRFPLHPLNIYKNKDENQYNDGSLNSKRLTRNEKIHTQAFEQTKNVFSIKNVDRQSHFANGSMALTFSSNANMSSIYSKSKKPKKLKFDNKYIQELFIKKINIEEGNSNKQTVLKKDQQIKQSDFNKKQNLKQEKYILPKKEKKTRKQLFENYSFLNKSNQQLKSNRLKDQKQVFDGWSHINSIKQDFIQNMI